MRKIVSVSFITAFAALVSGCGNGLSACDDPDIRQRVVEIINNTLREAGSDNVFMAAVLSERQVSSVTDGNEIYSDENTRACVGVQNRQNGEKASIGYTIQWTDKAKGEMWIAIINADTLKAKYGKLDKAGIALAQPEPAPAAQSEQAASVAPEQQPQQAQEPEPVAEGVNVATELDKCMSTASNEAELLTCANDEYSRQDHRLNEAYKVAMAASNNKEELKQTQREWIPARDKKCAGLTLRHEHALCLAMATALRSEELEAMSGR